MTFGKKIPCLYLSAGQKEGRQSQGSKRNHKLLPVFVKNERLVLKVGEFDDVCAKIPEELETFLIFFFFFFSFGAYKC